MSRTSYRKNSDILSFIFNLIMLFVQSKVEQKVNHSRTNNKEEREKTGQAPANIKKSFPLSEYVSGKTVDYIIDNYVNELVIAESVDLLKFDKSGTSETCIKLSPLLVPDPITGNDIARETARWLKTTVRYG